jgi:hypothetical protein
MSNVAMKKEMKLKLVHKHSDHSVYKAVQEETGYAIEYTTNTNGEPPAILVISPTHEVVVYCAGLK